MFLIWILWCGWSFASSSSCNRHRGCSSRWKWNYTQGMCIFIISMFNSWRLPHNCRCTLETSVNTNAARQHSSFTRLITFSSKRILKWQDLHDSQTDHIDPGFVLNLVVCFLAGDYNRPPPWHSTTFSCECANMSPYQLLFSPWGKSLHHITSPWRFFWLGCPSSTDVTAGPQWSLPI